MILQQLDDTIVHNGFSQHLELEELPDELDVADGTSAGLVLGLLQLLLQPLALSRLKKGGKGQASDQSNGLEDSNLQLPASRTDAVESSSFCRLSNTTSSTLSFSNSFWQRLSSSLRKLTEEVGLSVMGTFSYRKNGGRVYSITHRIKVPLSKYPEWTTFLTFPNKITLFSRL